MTKYTADPQNLFATLGRLCVNIFTQSYVLEGNFPNCSYKQFLVKFCDICIHKHRILENASHIPLTVLPMFPSLAPEVIDGTNY